MFGFHSERLLILSHHQKGNVKCYYCLVAKLDRLRSMPRLITTTVHFTPTDTEKSTMDFRTVIQITRTVILIPKNILTHCKTTKFKIILKLWLS